MGHEVSGAQTEKVISRDGTSIAFERVATARR